MTAITITNTYGAEHITSPTNSAHVKGPVNGYRITMTGTLPATHEDFADMVTWLDDREPSLHTRPDGYGLVLLESEEHAVTYFGPLDQIREYQRATTAGENPRFDATPGIMIEQWPHGKGWDGFLPDSYWNIEKAGAVADGVGIVTAFAHNAIPGAEVIVYEYEGRWTAEGDPVRMVTYHCTGCHKDTHHDSGHVHHNTDPGMRRWAARQARQHIVSAVRHGVDSENSSCRVRDGEMLRIVNEVAKKQLGTTRDTLPTTEDGYCNTKGPCSLLREMRAGVRPAVHRTL